MRDSIGKKVLLAAIVVTAGLFVTSSGALLSGQEAKDKKAKGRLPPYYTDIVTEEQRTQIYSIQEKHAKRINALREQLEAAEKQQDEEIEGVLTPEQKKKLQEARDEAAAKKKKKADDKKAAEGDTKAADATKKADGEAKKSATTDKKKPK